MIIDEITLQNFGVYKGIQSLVTTPTTKKPITLIGGLNGGGKTTFLDAIHLVLYGAQAKLSGRGRRSYGKYLQSMIHRGIDTEEESAVSIKFRRVVDTETQQFELSRTWKSSPSGDATERLNVTLNGEEDLLLAENWLEHMNSILPLQMAHLFFFDGEKIADLADPDKARTLLKTGVYALLGLNLVEQLQDDLVVLERRKRSENKPTEIQEELKSIELDIENLESEIEVAYQKVGSSGVDLARAQKKLDTTLQEFKKKGGELYEQQQELTKEKSILDSQIDESESILRELAAGAAPLALVEDLLNEVKQQAEYEIQAEKNLILASLLEQRDEELLDSLQNSKVPGSHIKTVKTSLEKDRQARPVVDPATCYLGADQTLVQQINDLTRHELPSVREQMKQARNELEMLNERSLRIESKLAQVPEEDVIATVKASLRDAEAKVSEVTAHSDKIKLEWEFLMSKKESLELQRDKILLDDIDDSQKFNNSQRLVERMPRVLETLEIFNTRVVEKHLGRIEILILESFQQLLRKKSLVTRMKIDSETYSISLYGSDGEELPFDRLSAGERQLLATAMLWGMVRASGRSLPLIIDTPLGRLDSQHRDLLTKYYFPVASHQTLLLSTDEEIDENLYKSLKSRVAHDYTLEYLDRENRSIVTKGYEFQTLAK